MRNLILIIFIFSYSITLSNRNLDSIISFDLSLGINTIETFSIPYGADLIYTSGNIGMFFQFKFNYKFNHNNYIFIGFTPYNSGFRINDLNYQMEQKFPNKEFTQINDESNINSTTLFIGYKRKFSLEKITLFPFLTLGISEKINSENFYILREKGTNYFNRYKVNLVRPSSFSPSIGTEFLFNKYSRFRLNTEIAYQFIPKTTFSYKIENERTEINKENYLNTKNLLTFKMGLIIRLNIVKN